VLALSMLRNFWETVDATAEPPMRQWFREAESAKWKCFADIKGTFNQTDAVRGKYIFDIGGNKWRVIAKVNFDYQRVLIRWVGEHKAYDKLAPDDIAAL
jgi:mRNA interferase HigB